MLEAHATLSIGMRRSSNGKAVTKSFFVCHYLPGGNVVNGYDDNVLNADTTSKFVIIIICFHI